MILLNSCNGAEEIENEANKKAIEFFEFVIQKDVKSAKKCIDLTRIDLAKLDTFFVNVYDSPEKGRLLSADWAMGYTETSTNGTASAFSGKYRLKYEHSNSLYRLKLVDNGNGFRINRIEFIK